MFKYYLKVALRNIFRHKGYSFINITGLAIGMAVFMLIALFIRFEFSYDRFHDNFDRIYRVEQNMIHNGVEEAGTGCSTPLSGALKKDFPEFEAVSRVIPWGSRPEITLPGNPKQKITANQSFCVDNSFFDIFSFPLVKGDRSTALKESNTTVISEKLAYKLFGDKEPLGTIIRAYNRVDLKITGVMKDVPANSHLKFDMLVSVPTMEKINGDEIFTRWSDNWVPVYVLLGENIIPGQVDEKIRFALKKYQGENCPHTLYLKPLPSIHLHSAVKREMGVNGSIKNIYIFSAVALFVLLIACINFMNITTARSTDRAREVGVRKVSGAHKMSLIMQFLCESMLTAVLAMFFAFILIEVLMPEFSAIVKRELTIHYFSDAFFVGTFALVTLLVGVMSGIYPAFFLSSYQPVRILKGPLSSGARNTVLRKSLVILQFSIGIVLIIGTVIVIRQVNHLLHKDLGYNSDQVLSITVQGATVEKNRVLRNELLRAPNVIDAGVSDYQVHSSDNWTRIKWEGAGEGEYTKINVNYVDENLMDTYGMTIVEGRGFSRQFVSDRGNVVILNESAARAIGWDDPIGKRILYNVDYRSRTVGGATVVGIVKDYHFLSLHYTITPLMIRLYPADNTGNLLSVKIAAQNIPGTISFLKDKFRQVYPGETFNYRFLDEDFHQMYREEQSFGKTIIYLAFLAIFIACLGLFGLAGFSIKQRTKEIGIRKALGAGVTGITKLLVSEFLTLTVIANLFAWPAAYFVMNQWLRNFPYRVPIHFWVFLAGGAAALLLALLTVCYQAVKSATANPVESLRYE